MFSNTIEFNNEEINYLRIAFSSSELMPRIVSLIVHGSSLYYPLAFGEKDSDIDLELILDHDEQCDMMIISNIIKQSKVRVECQLRYIDEIKSGLIFQAKYKLFMFHAYSNGCVLIGENIYNQLINHISEGDIKNSILLSLQIAYKDVRKIYLGGGNEYNVNKGIMQIFRLICMLNGAVDYKKLGTSKYFELQNDAFVVPVVNSCKSFLSNQDVNILNRFVKYYKSRRYLFEVFSVINKIVKSFSNDYKGE